MKRINDSLRKAINEAPMELSLEYRAGNGSKVQIWRPTRPKKPKRIKKRS